MLIARAYFYFNSSGMEEKDKKIILQKAKQHINEVRGFVKKETEKIRRFSDQNEKDFKTNSLADRSAYENFKRQCGKRKDELKHLYGSPYFVRCDVVLDDKIEQESWYFSKFQLSNQNIYSWVTPAASIRFEDPGDFSFKNNEGERQKGKLLRRDQFMIVDGKVLFLTTESLSKPRELVYQEHFSVKKDGFILPEIVAQMEKAQDQVIRAHHQGSFVISGPAGSGKTTLALHRAAYLVQSPDSAEIYQGDSIIVFVQDNGTKDYFSHLLPELGIENVKIVTFSEWAMDILEIKKVDYIVRYGKTEEEKDEYEYQKLKSLRNGKAKIPKYSKNIFSILKDFYKQTLSEEYLNIFLKQSAEKLLDRFDLVVLLKAYEKMHNGIKTMQEEYVEMNNGKFRKKMELRQLIYSLGVIDEFQNYLPEQLEILQSCINQKHKSILYVGELAQQVQLGTIRSWQEIGEAIENERMVVLQKVYRNTKKILEYIQQLGYGISIPNEIKEGSPVVEKILENQQEEIEHIKNYLKGIDEKEMPSVGILAKNVDYLKEFKQAFKNNEKIHNFAIRESQGVEFDVVFLVGIDKNTFIVSDHDEDESRELMDERKRIQKNLLYIALTRAMSELHVLGRGNLGL